jgi:hypothetical protein
VKITTHDAALICAALESIGADDSALYCRLAAPLPFAPYRSGLEWLEQQGEHSTTPSPWQP